MPKVSSHPKRVNSLSLVNFMDVNRWVLQHKLDELNITFSCCEYQRVNAPFCINLYHEIEIRFLHTPNVLKLIDIFIFDSVIYIHLQLGQVLIDDILVQVVLMVTAIFMITRIY